MITENRKADTVNREYKSRLFAMIFRQKEELLKLYNAMSGAHYTDPDELEINTLENAIYISMHNDLSFVIDTKLYLYEHQSTYNPNMPLRDLLYIADLYSRIVKDEYIFGTRKIGIPTPHFVVFYNGVEPRPERETFRLSDLYSVEEKEPQLELVVTVLNINKGYNCNLLNSCKTLKDYSEYIYRIRKYLEEMPLEDAVERAIKECISEGILAEFLKTHRSEAKKVCLYEFDEERFIRQTKQEGYEIGYDHGHEVGYGQGREAGTIDLLLQQIQKKLSKGKDLQTIAEELEQDVSVIEKYLERAKNKA